MYLSLSRSLSSFLSASIPSQGFGVPLRADNRPFLARESQGIRLKLRTNPGAGRVLTRKVVKFLGVPHLLSIVSALPMKVLRITIYEPRSRRSLETRFVGISGHDLSFISSVPSTQLIAQIMSLICGCDHKEIFNSYPPSCK